MSSWLGDSAPACQMTTWPWLLVSWSPLGWAVVKWCSSAWSPSLLRKFQLKYSVMCLLCNTGYLEFFGSVAFLPLLSRLTSHDTWIKFKFTSVLIFLLLSELTSGVSRTHLTLSGRPWEMAMVLWHQRSLCRHPVYSLYSCKADFSFWELLIRQAEVPVPSVSKWCVC